MKMESLNYKDHKEIKKDIQKLYMEAFPIDERPPVFIFFRNALKENQNLYGYYENNEFIGFASLTLYKDIVYIFFLAVSPSKRNKGYGSKILTKIKEENKDKVLLLCYEEVSDKYKDNDKRIKRREFYLRNGFKDNGFKTDEFGVVFTTAYLGSHNVSYEEYVEIFVYGFGEFAREYIKKEN